MPNLVGWGFRGPRGFYSQKYYGNGQADFTEISFDGSRNCYLVLSVDGDTLSVKAYTGSHEILDSFSLTR